MSATGRSRRVQICRPDPGSPPARRLGKWPHTGQCTLKAKGGARESMRSESPHRLGQVWRHAQLPRGVGEAAGGIVARTWI